MVSWLKTFEEKMPFVKQALILFLISSAIAIGLTFIAEWLEDDGVLKPIVSKAVDAFSFISASAILGGVYLYLSNIKTEARKLETRPLGEITLGDFTYVPKDPYAS